MSTAIYPGSFDPVTLGHQDIICRAAKMVDHLIIGVLNNSSKQPLFTVEERVEMLQEVTKDLPNVSVESFGGLLVEFAKQRQAGIIVRGLRAIADFEYELQIAQTNRTICPEVDTIFLSTSLDYSFLSSSIVKEIAAYGGALSQFVDPYVEGKIQKKWRE
jgi:pantetheine-phosphate adenylyltransferase